MSIVFIKFISVLVFVILVLFGSPFPPQKKKLRLETSQNYDIKHNYDKKKKNIIIFLL